MINNPTSRPALLSIRNISKTFGNIEVLKQISFDAYEGDVVCLLGPSGAGKSTLLRCINLLETPNGGEVIFKGVPVGINKSGRHYRNLSPQQLAVQRSKMGMVFQSFNLFPLKTALENVIEGPLVVLGIDRELAVESGRDLLARVGLSDKAHAYPSQLSGGQQQRVAIARSLAMAPDLMLFDEPTSALDPELVGEVLSVMKDVASQGMTMIVVTHEIGFAREVGDRAIILSEGSIIEDGDASVVLNAPAHPVAQSFLARSL